MASEYKSIGRNASVEIIEKKSRFIGHAARVESDEEARQFIDGIRGKHREASHNTYAYVTGKEVPAARYSDDGEPHGTAGLPILEVIKGKGLTDTAVVVTRYFGGTLLGTGGLVRAYSKSASMCISEAGTARHVPGLIYDIKTDYHNLGKIKNYLDKKRYGIIDETYTDHVIIRALIPELARDSFESGIIELTNAAAVLTPAGERYIESEE